MGSVWTWESREGRTVSSNGNGNRTFARFAIGTLAYTVATILWGAWVRITGSGAGCGSHWPTCNGEVIPPSPSVETLIEFSHRLTSGFTLVLAIILFVWGRRISARGSLLRKGVGGNLFFVLAEAALGAGLVIFELVENNDSVERAVVIALHLVNTFGLLGYGTIAVWAALGRDVGPRYKEWTRTFWSATALLLFVGMSGAITALGDTLFPVDTTIGLMERLQTDLSPTEHFLVRLRYIHPIVSIALGGLLLWFCMGPWRSVPQAQGAVNFLAGTVLLQLGLGWLNVQLGAPGWMQIIHLLMADVLWIAFVWVGCSMRPVSPSQAIA